ncbi:FemAB family protein [Pontivivens insulae]|uniref:BioF2-like acetyltransferase domain-containing protein n=1 Tax=Pontivivens insulae TaxID=1639689 RepID=A0A2R8A7H5_9RHOB|nr:FemAB family protein [Pontivivens insulae]RED18285.1 FemAB family protein [Pontivivens insulae]SPF28183.1 hypothetical protein POI8812_00481 [Pontivivens insulae]
MINWATPHLSRTDNSDLWSETYSKLAFRPYALETEVMEYFRVAMVSETYSCTDHSIILLSEGKPCGLWSIQALEGSDKVQLISNGVAVAHPEFLPATPQRARKSIIRALIAGLQELVDKGATVKCSSRMLPWQADSGLGPWHEALANITGRPLPRHHMFVELSQPFNTLRSSFRKSYKPLINRGLRTWAPFLMTSQTADRAVWDSFQAFHVETAGRQTRSQTTWDMQFDFIKSDKAFLVGLRNPANNALVGAGLFTHSPDEAAYSSGVYNRDLFDKPLGHVVQTIAIQEMQRRGLKWYAIGDRLFDFDKDWASAKEVSISDFKAGFASRLTPGFEFRLT